MNNAFKLSLLMMAFALNANAELIFPDYSYFEDFSSTLNEGRNLPEGWQTYGIGQIAAPAFQEFFGSTGEAPFFRVFNTKGQTAAWSCSTFVYADTADEWLVTPPIHISTDSELLKLKAVSTGAYATGRYRVLISEKSQAKEDFQKSPLLNTTLSGGGPEVKSKDSYIPINGYAGKEIYLAFVNKSEDAALLGVSDITIAPYFIDVTNLTPTFTTADTAIDISVNVNVRTPSETGGLKAELQWGENSICKTYDESINSGGSRILISFENIVIPEGGVDYTVTLTPIFDGAQPTVLTGKIGTPATSYPAIGVIEEFTGTWCSYCPRGTAFMNYYADHYNGKDENMKVIGIALHATDDPMVMDNHSYLDIALEVSKSAGYPSAFFNRSSTSDPSDAAIFRDMEATRSNSRIKITNVDYAPDNDIKVAYEVESSFSKSDINQRVAIVMVENEVEGQNPWYNQANALSGVSKESVVNTYGEDLWPYFQFFSESTNPVLFTQMTYDHVARGIWPDYYGELLNGTCLAEIPVAKEMTIDMPSQVINPDNTAIIALLLDADSGAIVGADEVEAADYNKNLSGTYSIDADSLTLRLTGHTLHVSSPSPCKVNIFSAAGENIKSEEIAAGTCGLDLSGFSGVVIVTANSDGKIKTAKYIL